MDFLSETPFNLISCHLIFWKLFSTLQLSQNNRNYFFLRVWKLEYFLDSILLWMVGVCLSVKLWKSVVKAFLNKIKSAYFVLLKIKDFHSLRHRWNCWCEDKTIQLKLKFPLFFDFWNNRERFSKPKMTDQRMTLN